VEKPPSHLPFFSFSQWRERKKDVKLMGSKGNNQQRKKKQRMEDMADQPKGKQRDRVERGDKKALQRMQKCLAESNFYEALQLIKMLTCRYLYSHPFSSQAIKSASAKRGLT